MAIYGYVRCAGPKDENRSAIDWEIKQMERKAQELGGKLENVFVDCGDSGKKTAVLARPAGKEMLETLHAGSTLIVQSLDRLGFSGRDMRRTVEALGDRKVHIHAIRGLDGPMDLEPDFAKIILRLFGWQARAEKALRSERMKEVAKQRKAAGLAYCAAPTGKKIVVRDGVKHFEWDHEQLGYIAEIALRLPKEGAAKVAADFWRRGIKDRRGLPWGQQVARYGTEAQAICCIMRSFGGTFHGLEPYKNFHRAARWFWRMHRQGLLPSPYGPLVEPSALLPEPKRYGLEPRPWKWTRGGTARREQERAEAKARHRAERLVRWRAEKAARVQTRVHKPAVARLGAAPATDESPSNEECP
jgi:DNA invertase Pin-like site-specific DNA recombinase